MAVLFLDTSALVKRYVRETGTSWLINQIRPATTDVLVANITGIEATSAIVRRLGQIVTSAATENAGGPAVNRVYPRDGYTLARYA